MTISSLRQQVADQLKRFGLQNDDLHAGRAVEALNRGMRRVFDALWRLRLPQLVQRTNIAITLADASFDLPARTRAIESLHDISGEDPVCVTRVSLREADLPQHRDAADAVVYREGAKFYFANRSGAPKTTTFRLRYVATPANAANTAQGTAYAEIPDEFEDLLVYAAVREMLPAGRSRNEAETLLNQRLADISALRQQQDIGDNAKSFSREHWKWP